MIKNFFIPEKRDSKIELLKQLEFLLLILLFFVNIAFLLFWTLDIIFSDSSNLFVNLWFYIFWTLVWISWFYFYKY